MSKLKRSNLVLSNSLDIPGYRTIKLAVEDFLDSDKLAQLQDYNRRFESLTKEELEEMNIIQSILLYQLGLTNDTEHPRYLVALIREEQKEDNKASKKSTKVSSKSIPKSYLSEFYAIHS